MELLFSFENLNKNKAKKFSILTLAEQMSGDSKLKEYNTDMIMKEELKDEAFSQRQPKLIHEQTLDVQLNNLFWAFVKGDSNYSMNLTQERTRYVMNSLRKRLL